jgi:hypothetical protein
LQAPKLKLYNYLEGTDTRINDLIIQGRRAFVGRVNAASSDVVQINIQNAKSPVAEQQIGDHGAGEHLALHNDDVFIGSSLQGLSWAQFGGSAPRLIATWKPTNAAAACQISAPTDPQPSNLADVDSGPVTLAWKSTCNPVGYELHINGSVIDNLKEASTSYTPQQDITSWQVVAIDAQNNRVEGPIWTFETNLTEWLATPIPIPQTGILYSPPPVDLASPRTALAVTCTAFLVGFSLVVGAAWGIGLLAERRTANRQ